MNFPVFNRATVSPAIEAAAGALMFREANPPKPQPAPEPRRLRRQEIASREKREAVYALARRGFNAESIAARTGLKESYVYNACLAAGVYLRPKKSGARKRTKERKAVIRKMYRQGAAPSEIAEALAVTKWVLHRLAKEMGLEIAANHRARRNKKIAAQRAAGMTLKAIGDEFGLSESAVTLILNSQSKQEVD